MMKERDELLEKGYEAVTWTSESRRTRWGRRNGDFPQRSRVCP